MTTNTDINTLIQQLREAAEKATKGSWRGAMTRFNGVAAGEVTSVLFHGEAEAIIANTVEKRDAEFIALANPVNTQIILNALEAAQSQIAEYSKPLPDFSPQPHDDYPSLKRQFNSAISYINSIRHQLSVLRERDYQASMEAARANAHELNSQRDANAQLTQELEAAQKRNAELEEIYSELSRRFQIVQDRAKYAVLMAKNAKTQQPVNNWISVEDRLPELDTPVFAGYFFNGIFSFNCYVRCWDNEDGWLWSRCEDLGEGDWLCDDDYSFLTHWQPMPLPPEPEGE